MAGETGKRVRIKTLIFFTVYDEEKAKNVLDYIRSKYEVIEEEQSTVVKELYYVNVEGRADKLGDYLKDKVLWHKIDIIEFK